LKCLAWVGNFSGFHFKAIFMRFKTLLKKGVGYPTPIQLLGYNLIFVAIH
jgi:hypothetical protein